jgi:ribosomal-protein-alanine N-acetyltransferase
LINKSEFFRRFNEVIPGERMADGVAPAFEVGVYFEKLSMSGLEEMHRYSRDARLYEFLEMAPFDTIDKTRTYIEKLERRMAGGPLERSANYWFVRRKEDNYLVGTAALIDLNFERQSIEWGYGVDPDLWGDGYIFQIQELLKHYVFEVLQLNRISGITFATNSRTTSSVHAAGMKHEGVSRQYYCKDGTYFDGWRYGMLRSDYIESSKAHVSSKTEYSVDDVIRVVASVITEEKIGPESTIRNVMTWDSLNHVEIMVAISEQLGVALSPSEVMRADSVKNLLAILNARG